MHQKLVEALSWALELKPDPAVMKWPVAVLAAAFFGLLLFAVFQYQTSERRCRGRKRFGISKEIVLAQGVEMERPDTGPGRNGHVGPGKNGRKTIPR